jgi:hypothetical protein
LHTFDQAKLLSVIRCFATLLNPDHEILEIDESI